MAKFNNYSFRRSEASVHQTASILSQCLVTSATPGAAPRKLVGRSLHTLNSLNNPASAAHHTQPHSSLEDAKQLLLMSQLPPGLSISGGRGLPQFPGLGHSPLGRTVSDSLTKLTPASDPASSAGDPLASLSRRKLESEDSSYDSDHEALTGSLSQELPLTAGPQLSKSHDDVSRTYSETLAQVGIQSIFDSTENIFISQEKLGCIFYVYTLPKINIVIYYLGVFRIRLSCSLLHNRFILT